jgi:hypothetical protein
MRKRKQETRKRSKRDRKNRSRRTRRTKSRNSRRNRRYRLRGGNYAEDVTNDEIDGVSVAEDVVITTAGYPSMDAKTFKNHMEYMDFQGPRQ